MSKHGEPESNVPISRPLRSGWRLDLRVIEPPSRDPGEARYSEEWWLIGGSCSVRVSDETALAIILETKGH